MQKRAIRIFREEGAVKLLRRGIPYIYNEVVWPSLPYRPQNVVKNEVVVFDENARWFDRLFGRMEWGTFGANDGGYEAELADGLRTEVEIGDHVVIVGGGFGVTAVIAARNVGSDGQVTVFEGAERATTRVEQTAMMNGVEEVISVNHCVVDRANNLRGEQQEADVISPTELPSCDVLELDCEGAEVNILSEMEIRPRVVLVETHANFGASAEKVKSILKRRGYEILSERIQWAEKGISVVIARHSEQEGQISV